MNWLAETASAVSAPATKLIEVVAAGCGRLYEPRHVRKMAEAQGDALLIGEVAKARASELSARAAQRMLDLEERRQINIEAIAEKSLMELPGSVSEEAVDPDWSVHFMQSCQDVSDEEMQSLWARLLAGEVAQPKTFSLRTIQVLKTLSKDEASAFARLCEQSPTIGGHPILLVFEGSANECASLQLKDPTILTTLEEAGLLSRSEIERSFNINGAPLTFDLCDGTLLVVQNEKPPERLQLYPTGSVEVGLFGLTTAGAQLSRLAEPRPSEDRIKTIIQAYAEKGVTVSRR